jgi:hypothetical protein
MMRKRGKITKLFVDFIRYALGWGYNSIWKWDDLPILINENYELLKPILQKWEEKGYIRVFEQAEERMIEIKSIPGDSFINKTDDNHEMSIRE